MDIDHHLNKRLRAANRVPTGAVSTNALSDRLDAIGARITATEPVFEPPVRSHRRVRASRRTVVVGSVVGVLAIGGAAAAAGVLSTYTGQSTSGWLSKAIGSGQELRVGVPGYCQAALNATSNIPFPVADATAWKDWALLGELGSNAPITINQLCNTTMAWDGAADGGTGHTGTTTGSLQLHFTQSAFCAWSEDWLAATANGDSASASAAATQIEGAFSWPLSSTIDPNPDATSPLGWFLPAQQAVEANDAATVQSLFQTDSSTGYCAGYLPPAGSDDGTELVPGEG
jgi:hypothetical protein